MGSNPTVATMKKCSKCKECKPLDLFSWKDKGKATKQAMCKQCHRGYMKDDYRKNKEKYFKKNDKATNLRMTYLTQLKATTPCKDCGKQYPHYVMQFDHVGTKRDSLARLACSSWTRMLAELKVCEIVC